MVVIIGFKIYYYEGKNPNELSYKLYDLSGENSVPQYHKLFVSQQSKKRTQNPCFGI